MKILFLDESGDHSLSIINPPYPIFVLGGIIVDLDYAKKEMANLVKGFKIDLFGREDINLHTADIIRNRNGFEQLKEQEFREKFYEKLNILIQKINCIII